MRDAIQEINDTAEWYGQLLPNEQHVVRITDSALIEVIPLVADYYREGPVAQLRRQNSPPLKHWWWWLDVIAEGNYPARFLPKWAKPFYKEKQA